MHQPSRRDFLKLATSALLTASGALGVGALIRFLDFQSEPPKQTEFDLGPASAYVIGSRTVLAEIPALLVSGNAGFTAMSLVCTHLGCTVQQEADVFVCPCHGSRYDSEGTLLQGPALQSLRRLRVESAPNGHLVLHTD